MFGYCIRRFFQSLFTLFVVVTLVFCVMRLMPVEGYLGPEFDKLDPGQQEAILDAMGLGDPLLVQFRDFFAGLARGDLGNSISYRPHVPVTEVIGPKIPYSLGLGLASVSLSVVLGIALGIFMARYKGGLGDHLGTAYIVVMHAVPAAVYYLFVQLYATSWFNLPLLFNVEQPVSWLLPILSMAMGSTAGYALWMRRFIVDQLNQDYIRLARAKGMRTNAIMIKHVLRNAFVPMAQYLPVSILLVLTGSLYIESLYSVPGMGGLLVEAIKRQDNPLVQTLVMMYASISIFGLFIGDVLMAVVDPRIKLGNRGGER